MPGGPHVVGLPPRWAHSFKKKEKDFFNEGIGLKMLDFAGSRQLGRALDRK